MARYFEKSQKLNDVCYDIRGPVMDEANRMSAAGMKILKLNIGNPAPHRLFAPDEIISDMIYNLRDSEGYSDSKGLFSARKAIMQYCQLKHIPNVDIADIYTGNGVSELITMSLQGLLDTGDEILVPAPDYPLWTASVTLAGGTAVHYLCDEQSDWNPDIADIRAKVTDRTKGIVVINPNNPTGALYPKEVLEQIVQVAREHNLIIFADEIYDRLVMDGAEHVAIGSLAPDLLVVNLNGLSKSHRVAGYRVGWMCLSGDKSHAKGYIEGLNLLSNMRLCSNVPGQSIIQTALGGYQSSDELLVPGGRIYDQREYICKAIDDIPGLSAVRPKAAFYIFPKMDIQKFGIVDDEQFALDLLREKHILITHGRGFHWEQPDHFRIVYLPDIEMLEKAMHRMGDFLAHYRQVQ
ncbi:MAG: aminotransferase class I/II-fold pyridoxal phosphate-dependent enzyme [Clostridia bacterium]|nr:aminotransferase class I/II-fold pyridoxal phosphate-dependent enzyme [Clostridia bacterium]